MSRREPAIVPRQILEQAEEIRAPAASAETPGLAENRLPSGRPEAARYDGEAVTRLPGDVAEKHGEIPRSRIVGLRNRLIHGHDPVDLAIVEQIIAKDLPDLMGKLRVVLD